MEGYVSDFSSDDKLLGLVDFLSGFKIWDFENKFLAHPNHLREKYTSLTWLSGLSICTNDAASSDHNHDDVKDWKDFVALGRADGNVDVYFYTSGSIEYKLNVESRGDDVTAAVTAMCWKNSSLYTIGNGHRIIVWSWRNCQFERWEIEAPAIPTAIVCLSANRLLVACRDSSFRLLSAEDVENRMNSRNIGHVATVVTSMKVLKEMEGNLTYVLTAAKVAKGKGKFEREIILWKIHANAEQLIRYEADFICCSIEGNKLLIATVNASNSANTDLFIIANITRISRFEYNPTPTLTVKKTRSHGQRFVPIVVAILKSSERSVHNIHIGYGSGSSLRFKEISFNVNESCRSICFCNSRCNEVAHIGDTSNNFMGQLIVALDESDTRFVRAVLSRVNTIYSTVAQLPQRSIHKLVEQLALLIERKICKVEMAVCWLNELLKRSNLMASPEITNKLELLLGAIQTKRRRILMPKNNIHKLKGMLDLLWNQKNQLVNSSDMSNDQDVPVPTDEEMEIDGEAN